MNPDTRTDPLWIWHDTWVPLCVFLNPVSPEVGQAAVWFYNAKTRTHIQHIPPSMAAFFSGLPPMAYEHPCELAAYGLTDDSLTSVAMTRARARWLSY